MLPLRFVLLALACASAGAADRISSADLDPNKDKRAPQKPAKVEPPPKQAAPPAEQRKQAIDALKDIYKDDYAKSAAKDKLALAQKMLAQAAGIQGDAAGLYALLAEAASLHAQAGEIQKFLELRGKLLDTFELSTADAAEFSKTALSQAALAVKDPALSKVVAALRTLAELPNDPPANLTAGLYLCFTLDNWSSGLPLLAKAPRPTLKLAAEHELGGPATSAEQLALGDEWWELAAKADKSEQHGFQQRALHWYNLALPELKGLQRAKVETRIQGANPKSAEKATPAVPLTAQLLERSQTLPVGVYTVGGALTSGKQAHIIVPAGTTIQSGKITLDMGASLKLEGTDTLPVVLKNVEIVGDLGSKLTSSFAILNQCKFDVVRENRAGSRIEFECSNTLFYKCAYKEEPSPLIHFNLQNCVLASMTFPQVNLTPNYYAAKTTQRNMSILFDFDLRYGCCTFIDCNVHPNFFWFTVQSNFINCVFPQKPANLTGFESPMVDAYLSNCTGLPNATTSIPAKLNQVKTPYPAPCIPPLADAELQGTMTQLKKLAANYRWISKECVYTVSSVFEKYRPSPKLLTCQGIHYDKGNFYTNEDQTPDIIIDLGTARSVAVVDVSLGKGAFFARVNNLQLWTGDSAGGPWTSQWLPARPQGHYVILLEKPVTCRYVRLGLTIKNWFHLDHVRIFEK
ncbi:MAG TPA: hypothetical protein VKX17_04465 [Planctomycetota bacterium]|nr:hypothetical protein [Planctomycetota bacterium]